LEGLVNIAEQKCKVCYACVRACPVNAIQVKSDMLVPKIKANRCIGCGSCIRVCSPQAIRYKDGKADCKQILDENEQVAVIVDPCLAAEFPDIADYRKLVRMIRELGFKYVVEGSFGVDLIAGEYRKLLEDFKGKYYIMANDPVVVSYIEKFQPELLPNLASIVTPSVAMAGVIHEWYGENTKIAYIGPLIASKKDSEKGENKGRIDAVITFRELRELFIEHNIDEKQLEYSEFDPPFGNAGALFPIANGILQAAGLSEDLLKGQITTVEGEMEMKEALREFQDSIEIIKSHFNIFYNEYLMGAGTAKGGEKYVRQALVKKYTKKRIGNLNLKEWELNIKKYSGLNFTRTFKNDDQRLPFPSEERIKEILLDLKKEESDNFGCGACGYNSCRDFAVAISKGLATPEMCNSYSARNKQDYIKSLKVSNEKLAQAEAALRESEKTARKEKEAAKEASEIITAMLQKLPSGLVILDEKLKILQANQSFIDMLGEDAKEINDIIPGLIGADLKTLLPYNIYNLFTYVFSNKENIQNRDVSFNDNLINVSVFMIRKEKIAGAIFRDMYSPEVRKEEVIKRVTDVIDSNLSLVQQIGFLLGEGASETEKMLHSIIEFYKDQPGRKKKNDG
jgi:Na+-translocating ferredoxin:NAD+ oxidoreductase RNF subunit RnfB